MRSAPARPASETRRVRRRAEERTGGTEVLESREGATTNVGRHQAGPACLQRAEQGAGDGATAAEPELEDVLRTGRPAVVQTARGGEAGALVRADGDRVADVDAEHDPVGPRQPRGEELREHGQGAR